MDLAPAPVSALETASPLMPTIIAGVLFVLIVGVLWWYLNRMKPRRRP